MSILMCAIALTGGGCTYAIVADDEDMKMAAKLLEEADAAYKKGNAQEVVDLATKSIKLDPKKPAAHYLLGSAQLSLRHNEDAAAAFREVVKLKPDFKDGAAHDRLGDALLKSGKFADAVAEFDKFLELKPKAAAQHWRRGIALYYAGKFDEGRKQFDLHRTFNPEDVENSAWHYLCNARATSPKQARAELIPVTKDARVPMKQVLELFAGKLKPQNVIDAAEKANLKDDALRNARFYSHLYVALYYESEGDAATAKEHLTTAVEKYKNSDYMWDVAAAHLKAIKGKKQ